MKRPERIKYRNGIYGDMAFIKQLNKYCSCLENKNKALQLLQTDVISSRIKELEEENKKLHFMIKNALGYEDMVNDCL